MSKMNKVKSEQLGISVSTAQGQLRKMIMFDLVKKCGMDNCFQCGEKIDNIANFSIEHKIPWLHSENPIELFYGLDNIAFSHTLCNTTAGRRPEVENFSKIDKKGEAHPKSKLSNEDVLNIRQLIKDGITQRAIAKQYNVHHSLIGLIKRGKVWTHVS
jgi:hypothetical protein